MDVTPRTQTGMGRSLHYDSATIALHWTSALLIGLLFLIGKTIDYAPNGPLRIDYRSLHMLLGVTLVAVYTTRIIWRLSHGGVLPPEGNVWLARAARLVHWVLYLLIPITLALGLANVWVRGDVVFNLFKVPAYDPSNKALRALIGDWHALAADAILIVAGLHAAAGLFHHYVLRDGVLRRMLPRL
jgi:cytochrome b561